MAIAHMITYETSSVDTVIAQTVAYKERELDRSPPEGFLSVHIYANEEASAVIFLTEWESAEHLTETADQAPWEAAQDLNETFSDKVTATTFKIIS
ncbi:antibiotic biosynthesis monooxygenase [Parvibaculaceae bacterium PLY_AMNH_Bact1]|nr:antibiotic biosynthesis monooxygenase [Parvibaculaceae bacterium PLY_AMNH_Bact1]